MSTFSNWAILSGRVRMGSRRLAQACFGLILCCAQVTGQGALSPRNASYSIQVRLDEKEKTLAGIELIQWRNITNTATQELRFHLYYNAWRNTESTWLLEDALRESRNLDRFEERDWGSCDIESIELVDPQERVLADLLPSMRFLSPDDGNPNDRTVMRVALPEAVAPGQTIHVRVRWMSRIPRALSRTGFRGNYFLIAQWFPKLGVLEEGGRWNCHQFHAPTEFYSDYGVFDVRMTVPSRWLVGATGVEIGVTDNGDGTSTHRYKQADVHDFAWTTSPDYREARHRFDVPGLHPVEMRLLYHPEKERQIERHFYAVRAALLYYGKWFGPYPYDQITFVDPAWGSNSAGMEYPTFFTCGARYLSPFGRFEPITVHETGHQFWYGMVGNNEFENAWLDEGINSYSHARVMEEAYPRPFYVQRFFRDFIPLKLPSVTRPARMTLGSNIDVYREAARRDDHSRPTYTFDPESSHPIVYDKTALWLWTLENRLGWETLRNILSTYFERWRFRHPTPKDFFAVAREIAGGEEMEQFIQQVHYGSALFDYGIDRLSSVEYAVQGLDAEATRREMAGTGDPLYETRVIVRRFQDGKLPLDILFRFKDGSEEVKTWNGEEEWVQYRFIRTSRLDYALVDPDHRIRLDLNYTNNSRLVEPAPPLAAQKWAGKWMVWLQDYMLTLSALF